MGGIRRAALVLTASLLLGLAPSAHAGGDVTVDNNGDAGGTGCAPTPCSLRQAIAAVPAGSKVLIPSSIGTITVGSELLVDHGMTIQGGGASTVVTGNDATRVFHVNTAQAVTITGLSIVHGKLTNVTTPSRGGAGVFNETGPLTLDNVRVTDNTLSLGSFGGGVVDAGGAGVMSLANLTVSNSVVAANTLTGPDDTSSSKGGAGIFDKGSSMEIDHSEISGNNLTMQGDNDIGGAGVFIASPGTSPSIIASTIRDNTASVTLSPGGTGGGAGVYDNGGAIQIFQSTISGNLLMAGSGGNAGGAGVFENNDTVIINDSTIASNTLTSTGGIGSHRGGAGVFQNAPAVMQVHDSTIASNTATNLPGGGLVNNDAGVPDISNSILAGNRGTSAANCYRPAGGAAFGSSDYNLESGSTCGLTMPHDMKNTNPLLGPLQNNGGATFTMAPLPGSPAVNTGNPACFTQDQLSTTRPQGTGCDRGAYEVEAGLPSATTGSATGLTGKTAVLHGTVNPRAANASVHFEYGTTTSYGRSTPLKPVRAGEGQAPVSATPTGLKPGTKYHYTLVATTTAGTSHGLDRTFTTPTKPKCTLKPVSKKIVKGKLKLRARCDRAAALRLVGQYTVTGVDTKRGGQLGPVTRHARKGVPAVLAVKVPKSAISVLAGGGTGSAKFTLKATGPGGVGTARARIAQLKLG